MLMMLASIAGASSWHVRFVRPLFRRASVSPASRSWPEHQPDGVPAAQRRPSRRRSFGPAVADRTALSWLCVSDDVREPLRVARYKGKAREQGTRSAAGPSLVSQAVGLLVELAAARAEANPPICFTSARAS